MQHTIPITVNDQNYNNENSEDFGSEAQFSLCMGHNASRITDNWESQLSNYSDIIFKVLTALGAVGGDATASNFTVSQMSEFPGTRSLERGWSITSIKARVGTTEYDSASQARSLTGDGDDTRSISLTLHNTATAGHSGVVLGINRATFDTLDEDVPSAKSLAQWRISVTYTPSLHKVMREARSGVHKKESSNVAADIHILRATSYGGLQLTPCPIREFDDNIEANYNDSLQEVHTHIVDVLQNKSRGIVCLHGPPGTGKTSYIRHLISRVTNKKFVYIPPSMFDGLTAPALTNLLLSHRNIVFVVEDAENITRSREDMPDGGVVSTLLNLGDGLLGDALAAQIICTFNASEGDVDQALLRDGRLIARYQFDALETDKANKLYNLLTESDSNEPRYTESTTLAKVYADAGVSSKAVDTTPAPVTKKLGFY